MNLRIRSLAIGDEGGLANLMRQLKGENISLERMKLQVQKMSFNMAIFESEVCLVAILHQKIIGFGRVIFSSEKHVVNIRDFVVDEKFRGNGIGAKLFKKLLRSFEDRNVTQVRVKTSSPAATAIYKKFGFFRKRGQKFFIKNYPVKKYA